MIEVWARPPSGWCLGPWIWLRILGVTCGSLSPCGTCMSSARQHEQSVESTSRPPSPQNVPPLSVYDFLVSRRALRKCQRGRERKSATSAIVANALLRIVFPRFRWKIKVLSGEALRRCDLWLVSQRFFHQPLPLTGEKSGWSNRSWGVKAETDEGFYVSLTSSNLH